LDAAIDALQSDAERLETTFVDFDFENISFFINSKLAAIAQQRECRVFYVAERSSHCWGTSHAESDHDVKAVVYYSPRHYYSPTRQLSRNWKEQYGAKDAQTTHSGETKEPEVELNCIELTKVCHLIIKNDPNIFEMFSSPLPYFIENRETFDKIQSVVFMAYDWFKLGTHYLSWSKGNYKQLVRSTKKRMNKKPLKILLYIWRGILSAEWLMDHKQCKGLPLYIPDLIAYSKRLDSEEKRISLALVEKVRASHYETDCEQSRRMLLRAPQVLEAVDGMMKSERAQFSEQSLGKRTHEMKTHENILGGTETAKLLDDVVFEVVESFS